MKIKLIFSYDGTNFSGWQVQPKKRTVQDEIQKDLKNLIDCGKISGVLKARQRINGDEVELAFRKCHKSLKKLFNESKIPLEKRAQIIVLADDNGIVWVEGFGVCERCCVDEHTKNAYIVKII